MRLHDFHDNYETDRIFCNNLANRYDPDVHSTPFNHIYGQAWETNRHPHLLRKAFYV